MIKTKYGATMIEGTLHEIKTDLTLIIREVRKCLSKECPEVSIDKFIADAVEMSKKDESEVHDMAVAALLKFLGGVL